LKADAAKPGKGLRAPPTPPHPPTPPPPPPPAGGGGFFAPSWETGNQGKKTLGIDWLCSIRLGSQGSWRFEFCDHHPGNKTKAPGEC